MVNINSSSNGHHSPSAQSNMQNGHASADELTWADIRAVYDDRGKKSTKLGNYYTAQKIVEDFDLRTMDESGKIYFYDEDRGCYSPRADSHISSILHQGIKWWYDANVKSNVKDHIRSMTEIEKDEFHPPSEHICVQNGVLDLTDPDNPVLEEHSPDYNFTFRIDAPYIDGATNDEFLEFINESVEDKDIPKLQEYSADCFKHHRQPGALCILLGPRDSGKGVYQRVIQNTLGEDNTSGQSLSQLADGKGRGMSKMKNKLINIKSELSVQSLSNPGTIKNLTGEGDVVTADEKYEKTEEFIPTANHLFSANQVPTIEFSDSALYSRFIFANFPTTVPEEEQIEGFDDQLTDGDQKRAGILNWLLDGYRRREKRSGTGFSNELTVAEKEDQWRAFGSSIERFVFFCLENEDANGKDVIPKKDIYEAYKYMCWEKGLQPEHQQTVTKHLMKMPGVDSLRPGQSGASCVFLGDGRPPCVCSLKWTDVGEEYITKAEEAYEADNPEEPEEDPRQQYNNSWSN